MNRTLGCIGAAFVMGVAVSATAQSQDSTRKDPWLSAFSVGLPSFEGDMALTLFTVGGNFTKIRPGALSPDFSIGTMPYALAYGVVVWGARAGVALPIEQSASLLIVPSAGLSSVGGMGSGGAGALFGANVGMALVSRNGARVGITWHRFGETETVMLLEVGVGRVK